MTDLERRLAELPPERRALVLSMLQKRSNGAIPRMARSRAPLSFAQERLWFLERYGPPSALYTIGAHVRLEGPLDVDALEQSLGAIVRRHEALRTTFAEEDGPPVQIVGDPAPRALGVVDLEALLGPEQKAEAERGIL